MKLYLGNLPFSASDEDIREAFAAYGTIEDLFIPLDRETNRPRGFAFITLADDDLARKAVEEMDGFDLQGRNLRVNEAEERRPQQSRGGGGGGGGGGGDRRGGGGGYGGGGGGGGGGGDRRGGGGGDRRGGGGGGGGGRDRDRDRRGGNDNGGW
ncbi:MAG: RNA-binding protein [Akkermansiaceae bacterium]